MSEKTAEHSEFGTILPQHPAVFSSRSRIRPDASSISMSSRVSWRLCPAAKPGGQRPARQSAMPATSRTASAISAMPTHTPPWCWCCARRKFLHCHHPTRPGDPVTIDQARNAKAELLPQIHKVTDRGREGFTPPRPPNRACGFPAHGSPVGGFLIGGVSRRARLHMWRTARHLRRSHWASVYGH